MRLCRFASANLARLTHELPASYRVRHLIPRPFLDGVVLVALAAIPRPIKFTDALPITSAILPHPLSGCLCHGSSLAPVTDGHFLPVTAESPTPEAHAPDRAVLHLARCPAQCAGSYGRQDSSQRRPTEAGRSSRRKKGRCPIPTLHRGEARPCNARCDRLAVHPMRGTIAPVECLSRVYTRDWITKPVVPTFTSTTT